MFALIVLSVLLAGSATAQSVELEDGCSGTSDDPCVRSGACSVQGTSWDQTVTISRSDIYDTMGWPGVCDQVHVALVQGNCAPGGARLDVTATLASSSSAFIPELNGPLVCGAEAPISTPALAPGAALLLVAGLGLAGRTWLRRSASVG